MEDWMYYGSILVVLIIAISFFRGGHLMLAAATLGVGAWIIYSHEENITYQDVKSNIVKSIDETAKSEYNERRLGTDAFDYNKSKVDK